MEDVIGRFFFFLGFVYRKYGIFLIYAGWFVDRVFLVFIKVVD